MVSLKPFALFICTCFGRHRPRHVCQTRSLARPHSGAAGGSHETPSLRPDQVRRTIVLIADDLALSADEIPNVRNVMKRFVDEQMQPGDLISIMTTSGGMGAMEQLTNDTMPRNGRALL